MVTTRRIHGKLKQAMGFLVSLVILVIILLLFLSDFLNPSKLLHPLIVATVILVSAAILFLVDRLGKKLAAIWRQFSRKKRLVVLLSFVGLAILLPLAISFARWENDQKLLTAASGQFLVESQGPLAKGQIDNSLIELEKQLTKLRRLYVKSPPTYRIVVKLYTDSSELQARTLNADWVSAFVSITPGQAPTIFLPTEEGGGFWTKTAATPNPAHETTHIVVSEVLKNRTMRLLPVSFHEGLAQYESLKDTTGLPYRIENYIYLILNKEKIISMEDIPDHHPIENSNDIRLFYSLSYEYVRFLAREHGELSVWQVVQSVSEGKTFDSAFQSVFGETYKNEYQTFLKAFFGYGLPP